MESHERAADTGKARRRQPGVCASQGQGAPRHGSAFRRSRTPNPFNHFSQTNDRMRQTTHRIPKRMNPIPQRTSRMRKPTHRMRQTINRIPNPINPNWKTIDPMRRTTGRIRKRIHPIPHPTDRMWRGTHRIPKKTTPIRRLTPHLELWIDPTTATILPVANPSERNPPPYGSFPNRTLETESSTAAGADEIDGLRHGKPPFAFRLPPPRWICHPSIHA